MAKKTAGKTAKKTRPPQEDSYGAISRAVAGFIGGFSLLNLIGELRYPHFDANHWWIDLRPVTGVVADILLAISAIVLLAYAIRPKLSFERRLITLAVLAMLLVVTIRNTVTFYVLSARGQIRAGFPIAFSLFVTIALAAIVLGVLISPASDAKRRSTRYRITMAGTLLVCLIGFPLGQIHCFGRTDYRRPADVIVVFGARVYADGSLSNALADRMRTACQLYSEGYAKYMIVSGGPGDGEISEAQAMRNVAVQYGVPADRIIMDEHGYNTRDTVANSIPIFRKLGVKTALATSHFYHLTRIKMSYQRLGWDVYTVPAEESYNLTAMPYYILREIVALWVYYLRPLAPI